MYKDKDSFDSLNSCHSLSTNQLFLQNGSEFVNTKLTAKANRQLQDPLVIMTNSHNVPKLDRKKKTIVRSNDLIKHADLILNDFVYNNNNQTASATTSYLSSYSSSSSSSSKPPLLEI